MRGGGEGCEQPHAEDASEFARAHDAGRKALAFPAKRLLPLGHGLVRVTAARGQDARVTRASALRMWDRSEPSKPVPVVMTSRA